MNATERFFLQILSDYVQGRSSEPPDEALDWGQLYAIAQAHGLCGVVWFQCRAFPDGEQGSCSQLHGGFCADVFQDTCRELDQREVFNALSEAGIPFLPMKGTVLRRYHRVPQLRTMGDIDLVIYPEDRRRSHEVMLALGFRCEVDNHAVWRYTRDVVIYEVHDHMMYEPLTNQIDYRSYFDCVWDHTSPDGDSSRWEVDEDFHFLYLITHTAKHIVNKGSGFRSFLDMAFFVQQAGARMDWKAISDQLERLSLLEFARTCFALCERWFGVSMPIVSQELDERFFEEATRKVFRDGLFGLENEENQTGVSAKTIRRSKLPYWLTVIGMTWRKLFPPYQDMQLIPWYSFVDGRPWLMPAAWLYRFFYCARHKLRHSRQLLTEPYTKRRSIESREQFISSWGL